jgi:aryl-phospho-beta-D-glucosidase BglC (GH1 family)
MIKTSLQIGLNLGGWLSQFPAYDHGHFKSYINADDLKRIADWGMDHVRLPVDFPVLEDEAQPGTYRESGFEYIEACLDWCRANGLRMILDLHKTPGFAFDELDRSTLFESPALQQRFLDLWSAIAGRFAGRSDDELAFELLNEIVLPDSGPWNVLVRQAVERIRELAPTRLILVGGNHYNAADELGNLQLLDDPQILYTFHFYLPLTVTHQKAPWIPPIVEFDQELAYPGEQAAGLDTVVARYPGDTHRLDREVGIRFDKEYLRRALEPALQFARQTGQPLYCGEFGVYEGAPMATRLNWTRDFIDLLIEHRIGRAYWNYKALDFGLVDVHGQVVSQDLIGIVSQREARA